ncbi:MAG: hypothetical protein IPK15_10040 [Verrucomicrobia bacterium]|nr:hypothetical protein [Verrucomicrobiota bacterium]
MKPSLTTVSTIAITLVLALAGCGHKEGDGHDHDHGAADHGHGGGHGHSHGDDAESFSGATHKDGKGITLLEETSKLLGIQTVEVSERKLPREVRFVGRAFGAADGGNPTGLLVLGTVSTNDAKVLRPGMPARLVTRSGLSVTGEVQQITRPLLNDDAEIIVAPRGDLSALSSGEFADVTLSVPGEREVLVVPREAVIHGSTGNLVYAVNGDAFLLTWVELGANSEGLIEITDGLLVGDRVVTRGAMDLWLVELRAQKGGQGCCPAPPKKGKG